MSKRSQRVREWLASDNATQSGERFCEMLEELCDEGEALEAEVRKLRYECDMLIEATHDRTAERDHHRETLRMYLRLHRNVPAVINVLHNRERWVFEEESDD